MVVLQVFFGSAQTGVGYQFYDKDGTLLGDRVTTGIDALPAAGAYAIEVEVPYGAAGIYWTSDTSEASEALTGPTEPSTTSDQLVAARATLAKINVTLGKLYDKTSSSVSFGDQSKTLASIKELEESRDKYKMEINQLEQAVAGKRRTLKIHFR